MPSLTALPTEIVLAIAELLGPADIKGLSCMNRRLRNAVTHILFRTLSIAMPLVSHLLLEHMLEKYNKFISRIHLHVFLRPNLEEDNDNTVMPSIGGTMKSGTLLDLVNGKIFSHIDSFSIHFDPCQFDIAVRWYGNDGDWGGGYGSGSITVFEDEEDEDACFELEEEHVWRAQYFQLLAEVMQNPNIKKLRFINLLPRRTKVFDTLQWEKFLGQLTHFDLGIFGAESDGGSGNAMPGFTQFVGEFLPQDIMKYLINVKHLKLEANELSVFGAGLYGEHYYAHDVFPLASEIPTLQSLELKNITLGDSFLGYLRKQADLRELTLHNCMCVCPDEPEEENDDIWSDPANADALAVRVGWSDIWHTIILWNKAIQQVTYLQDEQPPLLDEDPPLPKGSIVWRHVKIDKYWGNVVEDEEANTEEYRCGCSSDMNSNLMKVLISRRHKEALPT
ncbi:uncharacterized protein FIESC28_08122 [Fusarium coffeatum]|uniref:F-box domain-containing protein n=1 Tax=Fusarium coffeatum TaxID=231269 RepID=A0A366R8L2_9HYPO|nr:uncharacterized protein FIESC28_08122 [Fusarium coffeatum]RBR13494.1 hypothetical protein FIESC28_08122 [Fusarium coffeatum]